MTEPADPTRAPRAAPGRAPTDIRNTLIIVQSILIMSLTAFVVLGGVPVRLERIAPAGRGEPVAVIDVILDRERLGFLDIVFDRPLGEGHVGELLGRDPAVVSPSAGGTWRWQGANVLRLEPAGRFAPATEYRLELLVDRILGEGRSFTGPVVHTVLTDRFLVERVDLYEEPAEGSPPASILRGEARFNYPVDPRALASKLRILDPLRGDSSPVRIDIETGWAERIVSFRTESILRQADARTLRLVILSDLTPAIGNVPLQADFTQAIPLGSSEVLTLRSAEAVAGDPESTLSLLFSSPVSAEASARFVTVEPAAPHRRTSARGALHLTGAFAAGTAYEVTLLAGLRGADGSDLKETIRRTIRIPDLDPTADFVSRGMFLSASGYRNVAVESVNVDEVTLQIDRVYRNNLFVLFEYHPDEVWSESSWGFAGRRLGDRLVEERLKLGSERNRRRTTPIELGRYVSGETPGLYRVALKRPDQYEARQRWLLITDLGIVAKLGARECSVWISSFADLAAVPGAQVTLLSTQNQPLARGQTDASGFWRARELPEPDQQRDRAGMIVVEKGGDFSFLLLDRAGIDTAGADVGGAASKRAGYDAFVYGPRDIYRPGETAPGLIVVRDRFLKAAPSMPVLLRHKDPQGRQRATVRLSLDRRGQAAFRHEIPAYERTGRHLLEVLVAEEVVGRYPFHVEEFIPDRIKVEIAPSERPAGPGDTLAWDVAAAYLFGPQAAGLPAESRVRLEPALFAPAGFESYAFEDAGRVFEPRELAAFESLALDDQGRRRFETTIPVGLTPPSSLEAVLTARVQEQGGRGVSALARVKVHPFPFYLGLKKNVPEPAEPGRPVEFAWVSVRPDGAAVKSPELQARLYLDRWQTLLRRTPEGNYRYESVRDAELVETRSIAGGSDSGALSFMPREFGSYRVVLADEASGASTQVEFFAGGWGYSAWAIKDASRIEIEADRQEYRAGDTATVVVRTPFPGKLLLAVERDRVLEHQVHTLSGNTARLTVPIRAEHRPNVYVTAVLVRSSRDLQPGEAGRAFGAIPLAVDRSARRMKLGIAAPREIRPGTRLGIRVTARPGSSVTVAAVDEGILQLIAQKTPDPFEHFYRKIRLGVRAYDIFAQLLPEVTPAARPATGGDAALEGLAQFVRTDGIRRVEPVAFWSGSLQAGSDGVASAEFDVPEFQGALRLMAVGHAEDRFGSTDALVRVRSPLVLLPTLPRSLSLQEQVLVPVTLRNDSGRAGEFDVSLSAEGPARVQGPSTQQVAIPDGRERTLHFEVVTSAMTGDVRFALVARGNGEEASVRTGVPVRADLPAVTLERVGTFDGPETSLTLEETARLRPGSARIELRISPLPLVRFSTRLRDLLHYPYGCVEQTVSSVFPLLYFGDLAREWEPETFRKTDPDSLVQAGIRRLGSMQVHSGGFSNWPGQDETAPWGSVYAAHFLVEARRAGHQVDAWLYDRALEFTSGEARSKSRYAVDELQRTVYALYVLARAGRADPATMDLLRERHSTGMKGETRALLAAAYAGAGRPATGESLLSGLTLENPPARETGGNLNSALRNRALLLMALMDAAPGDPRVAETVTRLSREAEATPWWSTQETSFVFLALGAFHRRQAATADYEGTVYAGGRRLARFTGRTAVLTGIEPGQPIRVAFERGFRPGAAFFSLRSRGIPTDEAFAPGHNGLQVERALLDRSGRPLQSQSIRQGDLIVLRTRVRSLVGRIDNVVVQNLLASGLEVENSRLRSTETLPWISDADFDAAFLDMRDDRILLFIRLEGDSWRTSYALLRAVTPGTFRLPPVQAEAMYDASLRATGDRASITIVSPP